MLAVRRTVAKQNAVPKPPLNISVALALALYLFCCRCIFGFVVAWLLLPLSIPVLGFSAFSLSIYSPSSSSPLFPLSSPVLGASAGPGFLRHRFGSVRRPATSICFSDIERHGGSNDNKSPNFDVHCPQRGKRGKEGLRRGRGKRDGVIKSENNREKERIESYSACGHLKWGAGVEMHPH